MADEKAGGSNGSSGAAAGGRERRKSVRVPVEMWCEDITDGGLVYRRAGNLSRGGLYLDQTIPIPVGTTVKLRFTLPGDTSPITVDGQIVSVIASQALGMGLKFLDLPAEILARIDAYLTRALTPPGGLPRP